MLDGDLHLVAFAEECKDGVLVGGPSDVVCVDLEDSVAHAQLARVGCGATGDDLERNRCQYSGRVITFAMICVRVTTQHL